MVKGEGTLVDRLEAPRPSKWVQLSFTLLPVLIDQANEPLKQTVGEARLNYGTFDKVVVIARLWQGCLLCLPGVRFD